MCKVIEFSTHYAIGHSFEACRRRNGKIMANFKGLLKDEALKTYMLATNKSKQQVTKVVDLTRKNKDVHVREISGLNQNGVEGQLQNNCTTERQQVTHVEDRTQPIENDNVENGNL